MPSSAEGWDSGLGLQREEGNSQEIRKACLVISCCPGTQISLPDNTLSLVIALFLGQAPY